MTRAEMGPVCIPPENDESLLNVIEGDGTNVWSRTPEGFGVNGPINASLFAGSNLLRNLHDHEIIIRNTKRSQVQETVVPRTTSATIVREVYRRCLPKELHELADRLGNEASDIEYAYEAEGIASDPSCQAELIDMVTGYRDSLLMQGCEAFIEAAYDYDNGLHETLLRKAQLFGAYLIYQTNP